MEDAAPLAGGGPDGEEVELLLEESVSVVEELRIGTVEVERVELGYGGTLMEIEVAGGRL
jgi:hypothetical protein